MKFWWYICIQQVIPGALSPRRPLCFTSTHSALPNQSWVGTQLCRDISKPMIWIRAGLLMPLSTVWKPGSISVCLSKAKLEPVLGSCPGEWVLQPFREAVLSSPGALKGDVCTSAEPFSCRWALTAIHLHGNPSSCNREWWSNIARLQRLGRGG